MNAATKRNGRVTRTTHDRRETADPSGLRLVVKREGGVSLLPLDDVQCLEAEGNVVTVHAGARMHRIRVPLSQLLERLDGLGFIRIHRSTVVRLSEVVGIEKGAYRKAFVTLRSGQRFEIGRAEFNRLRAMWQPGLLDLAELSRTLHLVSAETLPGA